MPVPKMLAAPGLTTPRPELSIVCPFYNEEAAIGRFFEELLPVLAGMGLSYEIVCVNDGSRDATQARLLEHCRPDGTVRVIELSRNFGKEAALTAGLEHARGAAVVPIDADLQDPPNVIPELVARWREGFEVVLARRTNRSSDTVLKRASAAWFYKLHNRIADVPIPDNVGDFRLIDATVVRAMLRLPERRRFMKGLFAWVGFRTTTVDYARAPRSAGETKFNSWKLWNFALEGITAFSTAPLRMWTYIGVVVSTVGFLYALFIIARTLLYGSDVPGYASLLTVVLFMGGIQLIGLGVIGEYIGRIYSESKGRPVYIVRSTHGGPADGAV